MQQRVKSAIVLALLLVSAGAQASGSARHTSSSPQADNPFGYERQVQKMMRPINDLLPQNSSDEAPANSY